MKAPQEQIDIMINEWIREQKHRLRLLHQAGFNEENALRLLMMFHIDCLSDVIKNQ